jgi:hypothetical protein
LAVQELIEEYENKCEILTSQSVEKAFHRICNMRNNNYFDSYHSRLKKALFDSELAFAQKVLSELAKHETLSKQQIVDIATQTANQDKYSLTLEVLITDGYIAETVDSTAYSFQSPVLQLWWKKYISN